MKNRFFYLMLFIGALSMTLASCNEDILPDNGEENKGNGVRTVKLGLQIESATKVTLSEGSTTVQSFFVWETGDKIGVWVGTSATSGVGFQEFEVSEEDSKKVIKGDITEGKNRFNYAVYPNSVNPSYNTSTGELTITLKNSYALSEVSGTKTPLPMVAINDNTKDYLTFYNVGGMLRLTVKSIPADATGLVIQFPGNKVNGTFAVTNPGSTTPSIATGVPANGEDKITVNFDAGTATEMTLNIPLPTGTYEDVYITPVGSPKKVAAVRHINGASYTATRAHGKALTTTMVSFSVSETKKVIFAPGNLWATSNSRTNWTWSFAPYQYSRIGSATANTAINGNGSVSTDGTVDLFGFSTSNTSYGIWNNKTASNYSGDFDEWGKNNIGGYSANEWGTLSGDEMTYLLNTREGDKYVKVYFNFQDDIKGIIIFPDGFVWDNSTMGSKPSNINTSVSVFVPIASRDNWNNIESAGAIFLPVAGYRNGTSVAQPTNYGYYWLSNGQVLYFRADAKGDYVKLDSHDRYYGHSVRLVHVL